MKAALFLLLLAALAATWVIEKSSATHLASEIAVQQERQQDLANLQHERDRLRALLPTDGELATLRQAAVEHTRAQNEIAARETRTAQASTPPLGEWTSASDWKNHGQATPYATVETALWAAAGGDTGTLKRLLSLPVETQAAAEALLARLPATARALYGTPEDLIAAFTIKNIPVGESQLVWFHEDGADATACVFLKNPPTAVGSVAPASVPTAADPHDRPPPTHPADDRTSEAFLSLHREGDAWHLVVPLSAINKIAKELAATPGQ